MKEQADDLNMRNRLIDAEPDRQSADEDEENNGDTDVSIKPAQKKKLTIVGEDGSEEDVEIILNFEFADTKKEYLVYTKYEQDENEEVTVYVSAVDRSHEKPQLTGVEDDDEWERVQSVLKELAKPQK